MARQGEWSIRSRQRYGRSQQSEEYENEQVVPIGSVDLNNTSHSSSDERRSPQLEDKRYLSSESQRIRRLSNSSPLFNIFVYNEETGDWDINNTGPPRGGYTEPTGSTGHLMMDHSILADGHQHFQTSNKWLGSRDGPSLSTYHTLSPMWLPSISTGSSNGHYTHHSEGTRSLTSARNQPPERQRGSVPHSGSTRCEPLVAIRTLKSNLCSRCYKKLSGTKLHSWRGVLLCRPCFRSKNHHLYTGSIKTIVKSPGDDLLHL